MATTERFALKLAKGHCDGCDREVWTRARRPTEALAAKNEVWIRCRTCEAVVRGEVVRPEEDA